MNAVQECRHRPPASRLLAPALPVAALLCAACMPGLLAHWLAAGFRPGGWADPIFLFLFVQAILLPAMFAASGYWTAAVTCHGDVQGYLCKQAVRLLWPWLAAAASVWYASGRLAGGQWWRSLEAVHGWFLAASLLMSAAAALLAPVLHRALRGAWFAWVMRRRAGLPVRAAVTILAFSALPFGILDAPMRLAGLRWPLWAAWLRPAAGPPDGRDPLSLLQSGSWAALAYLVFFLYGWGAFVHRRQIRERWQGSPWLLGCGLLCAALAASVVEECLHAWTLRLLEQALLFNAVFSVLGCWLVLDALAGPVLRSRAWSAEPSGCAGDAPCEPPCGTRLDPSGRGLPFSSAGGSRRA